MDKKNQSFDLVIRRLRHNYPNCRFLISEGSGELHLPLGKICMTPDRVSLFVEDTELKSWQPQGPEALYEAVESCILLLGEGEQICNPRYVQASGNAAKRYARTIRIGGVLSLIAMVGFLIFRKLGYGLAFLALPLLSVVLGRFVRLWSLRKDWVCPGCGERLQISKKEFLPQIRYASVCPKCGRNLLEGSLVQKSRRELLAAGEEKVPEEKPLDVPPMPVKRGGKALCIIFSGLMIFHTLLLLLLMAVGVDEGIPAGVLVMEGISMLPMIACTLALLRCRTPEKLWKKPAGVTLCESRVTGFVGAVLTLLGMGTLFVAFCSYMEGTVLVALLAVIGSSLLMPGIAMLLARRNRLVKISDSEILYVSSFGRKCSILTSQITSAGLTAYGSIRFLNSQGKKLFSVEKSMQGIGNLAEWIEKKQIAFGLSGNMEKRIKRGETETVFWREAYRTVLHDHMKAIRVGLICVMTLFVFGCLAPIPLCLLTEIKRSYAIYLTAFSPVPLILYYILFAPVLLADPRPPHATGEWNAMHIRFPTVAILFLGLTGLAQIVYIWNRYFLTVVDEVRFFGLVAGVTAVVILLFVIRTPKRLRNAEGFAGLCIAMSFLVYIGVYGTCLAFSGPAEHAPAVILERSELSDEGEETDVTLTVLTEDETEVKLRIPKELYALEQSGTRLVICQKESILGIRMVRLHPGGQTEGAAHGFAGFPGDSP